MSAEEDNNKPGEDPTFVTDKKPDEEIGDQPPRSESPEGMPKDGEGEGAGDQEEEERARKRQE